MRGWKIKALIWCSWLLSRGASLSCHTCCDIGPLFLQSHLVEGLITSLFTSSKGIHWGPVLTWNPHENDCLNSWASDIWMPDFQTLKHPPIFSWVPEQNFLAFCLIYQKFCVLNPDGPFLPQNAFSYYYFFPLYLLLLLYNPQTNSLIMAFKTVLPSKMFSNSWMAAIRTWNCFLLRSNC